MVIVRCEAFAAAHGELQVFQVVDLIVVEDILNPATQNDAKRFLGTIFDR